MRTVALTLAVALALSSARAAELPREPPLLKIKVKRTVQAKDYGATPDDGKDDLGAIRAAIRAAVASEAPAALVFEKGAYHIHPGEGKGQAVIVAKARDLLINGNGAHFVVRNSDRGFLQLRQCERVLVEGLSLEYKPRPFTQGIVKSVDVDARKITVDIGERLPSLDEERFRKSRKKWGIIRARSAPCLPKRGALNVFVLEDWRRVTGRTFEIDFPGWAPLDQIDPGDAYVQVARSDSAAFFALHSIGVTFSHIRIYSAPAAAFLSMHCSSVGFVDCKVAPREGHWLSTGADGIYSLYSRIGPWIEGCTLEALGDDGIVIKTFGANCIKKIDDRTFILRGRVKYDGQVPQIPMRTGDLLRVFDLKQGQLVGEAKVVSAVEDSGSESWRGPIQVVVDTPMPHVVPGTGWDSPVFYNDATAGPGFVVRNNVVRSPRRWGMLCESHDGLIEDNTFEATPAHALLFMNADQGHIDSDGFASHNVTVRDNTFADCFRQNPAPYSAFAAVVATTIILPTLRETAFRSKLAPWQGQQHITFERNRFIDWRGVPALRISNAHSIVVRGNIFETQHRDAQPAIHVSNASRVKLEDNRISGPERPLAIDPDSTTDIMQSE